nr:hypothetical protein [Mycoplasmopsis bovis]
MSKYYLTNRDDKMLLVAQYEDLDKCDKYASLSHRQWCYYRIS